MYIFLDENVCKDKAYLEPTDDICYIIILHLTIKSKSSKLYDLWLLATLFKYYEDKINIKVNYTTLIYSNYQPLTSFTDYFYKNNAWTLINYFNVNNCLFIVQI